MGHIRLGFLVAYDVLRRPYVGRELSGEGKSSHRSRSVAVTAVMKFASIPVWSVLDCRSVRLVTRYKSLVGDAMPERNVVEAKHKIAHNMQL